MLQLLSCMVTLMKKNFMKQPDGFVEKGKESKVCLLKRSLYGLKQSPRQWNLRFDEYVSKHGFSRSQFDACVYIKVISSTIVIYMLLYVDDILIACKSKQEIVKLKTILKQEFEMKDLGRARKILGMEITRDRKNRILTLTQSSYLQKVLDRFGMNDAKSVNTPLAHHFKLSLDQCPSSAEEEKYMEKVPYASAVGSLMYSMVCTRPDLAYSVSMVSRYMANPGKEHWSALKWILRYVKGSITKGLVFDGLKDECRDSQVLKGYVDADYAGCLDTRKSLSGYVFVLFGIAISWKACLQKVVALSTTEA